MSTLTQREREVVRLLAQGRTPGEIATILCICKATVYDHISAARDKTATSSTLELAIKASKEHK